MDQILVHSGQGQPQVRSSARRDGLATAQQAASPEIILDVVGFQLQVLMEEEENFVRAVEDLHLESEEERMSLPTFL